MNQQPIATLQLTGKQMAEFCECALTLHGCTLAFIDPPLPRIVIWRRDKTRAVMAVARGPFWFVLQIGDPMV